MSGFACIGGAVVFWMMVRLEDPRKRAIVVLWRDLRQDPSFRATSFPHEFVYRHDVFRRSLVPAVDMSVATWPASISCWYLCERPRLLAATDTLVCSRFKGIKMKKKRAANKRNIKSEEEKRRRQSTTWRRTGKMRTVSLVTVQHRNSASCGAMLCHLASIPGQPWSGSRCCCDVLASLYTNRVRACLCRFPHIWGRRWCNYFVFYHQEKAKTIKALK